MDDVASFPSSLFVRSPTTEPQIRELEHGHLFFTVITCSSYSSKTSGSFNVKHTADFRSQHNEACPRQFMGRSGDDAECSEKYRSLIRTRSHSTPDLSKKSMYLVVEKKKGDFAWFFPRAPLQIITTCCSFLSTQSRSANQLSTVSNLGKRGLLASMLCLLSRPWTKI
ncbi:hypothetical protein SCHPADRAFT_65505 [Schizopora paradoxa]|uniref:Uncharacterized protein n=1 Tax=Schizopora paradoxa TaxID=27342 RepID=A0A0H2S5J7_9AGAM|nr:hypothetical protein SCHPADRAFT_65505 [Schizopora paradoxa]